MIIIDAILALAVIAFLFGGFVLCTTFREKPGAGGGSATVGIAIMSLLLCTVSGGIGLLFALIKLTLTVGW